MRITKLAVLTATSLLALTGCGGGTDDAAAPAGGPSGSPPAPTDTAPAAAEYTNADLVAALPRGKAQLHGLKLSSQCRTPKKRCDSYPRPGVVGVHAQAAKTTQSVTVSVYVDQQRPTAQQLAQLCQPGPFATEPTDRDRPGAKGMNERSQLAIGAWQGYSCRSIGTYDGGSFDEVVVGLWNGQHGLEIVADDTASAEAYAREYLERLEG